MQLLPLTLRQEGFDLRQIAREGQIAIYEKSKGFQFNSYEVIKIQTHKEHVWPTGAVSPEGEHYPTSRQWGDAGWTFRSLELAQAKMDELQKKVHEVPCA